MYRKIDGNWTIAVFLLKKDLNTDKKMMRFKTIEKIGNDEIVTLPKQKTAMICYRFYPEIKCNGSCGSEPCDGFKCPTGECISITSTFELCGGSSGDSSSPIIYPTTEENPVGGGSTTNFSFSPNTFSNLDLNDPNFINQWHTKNVWLNLDGTKVLFFRSSQENMDFFIQTIQYQIDNNWSQKSATIANLARDLKHENPSATWEDVRNKLIAEAIEDQIDDSELDPCTKGVFTTVKNTTVCDIAQVLSKLDANGSLYNTIIKSEVAPSFEPAQTVRNSAYNYTVYISTDYTGKTKLFAAALIFHEMVHAYFMSLFDDYHNANPPNLNAYNEFPTLFHYYVTLKRPASLNSADFHHQQMAESYVDAIARALQEYQTGVPVVDGTSPEQNYSDLAWGTLQKTPIFESIYPIGNQNRQRILNRYQTEQTGLPAGQGTPQVQSPLGQPCN